MIEKKFKILRFIGSVYKVLGIIAAVLTIVAALGICVMSILGGAAMDQVQRELGDVGLGLLGGMAGGAIIAVGVILYGGIMALLLYGVGEGIFLLLSLEENTRITADYLQRYSEQQ